MTGRRKPQPWSATPIYDALVAEHGVPGVPKEKPQPLVPVYPLLPSLHPLEPLL